MPLLVLVAGVAVEQGAGNERAEERCPLAFAAHDKGDGDDLEDEDYGQRGVCYRSAPLGALGAGGTERVDTTNTNTNTTSAAGCGKPSQEVQWGGGINRADNATPDTSTIH
ncbi:hypothetical protein DUNSADRAFT_10699 [Dunaliella salina]|uniref:Secreted protein n=1 Tax=Dunaliella salina TaxID=3046 RepID=A0ABQ7GEP4_DUNSA|nr:hypothetical protein DUNSADRAFT_10699 [Dunaliella salina]|eukprot:KAF5833080.1 hypothetical protein DUNSADRAFT_10699 [Dunaliella salina]